MLDNWRENRCIRFTIADLRWTPLLLIAFFFAGGYCAFTYESCFRRRLGSIEFGFQLVIYCMHSDMLADQVELVIYLGVVQFLVRMMLWSYLQCVIAPRAMVPNQVGV